MKLGKECVSLGANIDSDWKLWSARDCEVALELGITGRFGKYIVADYYYRLNILNSLKYCDTFIA
jgi:hypothetical protein